MCFGCTKEHNTDSRSELSTQIPRKKSELRDWQGFQIRKHNKLCELVIPASYGFNNKKQLMLLRDLVNASLVHDVECMMPVKEDVLNHIRYLATEKQDFEAAFMLLNPAKYGGFDLDADLAEEFVSEYKLYVLERFENLQSLLTKELEEDLSSDICSWLEVLGEAADLKRVNNLLKKLRLKKLDDFADKISDKCGKIILE